MLYKDKIKDCYNISTFSLIRLVRDKFYEDNTEPFYSFYDGDYFCGFDDNGNVILSYDIDNAEVVFTEKQGNGILNSLLELIRDKRINYQHIFVQDFNELNESMGWLQHYPNYRYDKCLIPFKPTTQTQAYYHAAEKLSKTRKLDYIDEIRNEIQLKNFREISNEEMNYIYYKDWQTLRHIIMCNRGRRDFNVFINDKKLYGK